jgi:hypothetical protein
VPVGYSSFGQASKRTREVLTSSLSLVYPCQAGAPILIGSRWSSARSKPVNVSDRGLPPYTQAPVGACELT